MEPTLENQLDALATIIEKLATSYENETTKTLLDLQDRLIDLSENEALKKLQSNDDVYRKALDQIKAAITIAGDGSKKVDKVKEIIAIVGKAINYVVQALEKVV